uniref:Cytochrome P450 n=1 Tax=Picea sitchensis TaxID=3332 RepID=C0PS63_PICSI|nr:unknown [Picea sitchensis]
MAFHNLSVCLPLPATSSTAAILCIFFSFFFIWFSHNRRIRARLPPGPYALPIIGNLHQLVLPAHRTFKSLADKYGPIFFLRLGSVPTVVVSSSEIAKQFLKNHDLIFASRPPRAAGRLMFFNSKDVAFAPYGDHWRQMRKICVLELLTAKRIESFKHVREEEVSAMIRSVWEESGNGRTGVNVSKAISTLTSNIVWRILANRKFSDDDLGGDFKGFKDLLVELTARVGDFNIGDFIPYLDWLDLQGISRCMKKIHKTFDEFAEKIIDDHVNVNHLMAAASNGQKRADAEPHVQDFVDVLLHMAVTNTKITRKTIKALVLDMFAGGLETTSTTLEWAMSELLRHPNVMKRLQEEIDSIVGHHGKVKESDLATMKYLHCVVKETLRLYPAVPLAIPHESVEAVTVGGYYIPKKATVMVNVWAIGRDPNVWGAYASDFKPERFMENEHINLTDQSDFSMIPFGSGRRGCPGASMAIPTIELALAQLLHTFDWRVEGDPSRLDMKEACGLTIPRQVPLCAYPSLRVSFPL